jgi:hypothetical protein
VTLTAQSSVADRAVLARGESDPFAGRLTVRVGEVATALGVPSSTVWGWVRGGLVASVRIAAPGARRGTVLIPVEEITRALTANRVPRKGS